MNDAIPRPQAKTRKALTPLLEIRNLTKSYDGQHAVDDVSLTIYKGEIFALLGASGCGKSTLLRMLAGFEQPSAGQIMLDGVDLSQVPPLPAPHQYDVSVLRAVSAYDRGTEHRFWPETGQTTESGNCQPGQ